MSESSTITGLTSVLHDATTPEHKMRWALEGLAKHGCTVRGAILVVRGSWDDVLDRARSRSTVDAKHQGTNRSPLLVLRRSTPSRGTEEGILRLAPSHVDDVWGAYSAASGHLWSNVISYWLDRAYPHVAQLSLRTDEIEHSLRRLQDVSGVAFEDFRITEFTYRSRLSGHRSRRQQESDRRWTDLDIDQVFQQLYELDASLERVRFEAWRNGEPIHWGSLGRRLEFSFAGDFSMFHETVLQPVAKIAGERNQHLSGRQRDSASCFEAKPFFIEYETDVLESIPARQRLIGAIAGMKNTAHSVLHANPYVHVSLLDYVEETNCDIYVLSPRRIAVVPQTSSTSTALERLYSHICSTFGEGKIVDFSGGQQDE